MKKVQYKDCTSGDIHTLVEGTMYAHLDCVERMMVRNGGISTGIDYSPDHATPYIPRDSFAEVGDLYWILDDSQDVYWLSEITSVSNGYTAVDRDSGDTRDLQAETLPDALQEAEAWIREAYCGNEEAVTFWVDATVTDREDEKHRIVVQIDPPEPDCVEDEHEWLEGAVFGNGGGLGSVSVCVYCGTEKHWSSGRSRTDTGQGRYTTVEYRGQS